MSYVATQDVKLNFEFGIQHVFNLMGLLSILQVVCTGKRNVKSTAVYPVILMLRMQYRKFMSSSCV
jgi:hypothetical protein